VELGHLGVLTVDLHLPESHSLKGKRRQLLRVRNALARRIACSVAEVDHHDRWQRARLSVALVDRSAGGAAERLDAALRMLHGDEAFEVVGEDHDLLPVEGLLEEAGGWGT